VSGTDPATFFEVVGGLAAGAGTVFAAWYVRARDARGDLKAEAAAAETARAEREAAHALAQSAYDLADATRTENRGLRSEVTAQDSRIAILESKMDVFWRNVAFDVSKILHSPHEGWEELDALLEKFRASLRAGEPMTDPEMASLETQLRDMVEGRFAAPAEVTRADKVAASLMLRAIEQTRV
jgi:hypothetical protein